MKPKPTTLIKASHRHLKRGDMEAYAECFVETAENKEKIKEYNQLCQNQSLVKIKLLEPMEIMEEDECYAEVLCVQKIISKSDAFISYTAVVLYSLIKQEGQWRILGQRLEEIKWTN